MQLKTLSLPVVLFAALAGGTAFPIAQNSTAIPVPLSDPSRPATVRIEMLNGTMTIRGENRKDVLVTPLESTSGPGFGPSPRPRVGRRGGEPEPPTAGLKQLTQRGGFEITESNNVVSIESGVMRSSDIEVRVPTRTNLNLEGVNGSGIIVENVEGDIEAEHTNGHIRLTNVSGSVVTEATNGNVVVVLTRIATEKAMSFVTLNGNVDVTLPASAKANVRLRSDNGDIFTGFDVETRAASASTSSRNGRTRIEVNQAIFGTINGGGPEFELRTFNGNVYLRRAGAN